MFSGNFYEIDGWVKYLEAMDVQSICQRINRVMKKKTDQDQIALEVLIQRLRNLRFFPSWVMPVLKTM